MVKPRRLGSRHKARPTSLQQEARPDRKAEAMAAYEAALRGNPGLADCHYNLAQLSEKLEKPKDAIRHLSRYRTLIGTGSSKAAVERLSVLTWTRRYRQCPT